VLGSWAEALADPLGLCGRAFCALGDVARVRGVASNAWLLVSHPAGVEHVLASNARGYRAPTSGLSASLFGRGVVVGDRDSWLARPLAEPVLDPARLSRLVTATVQAAGAIADGWESAAREGRSVDMVSEMRHLARAATLDALLSLVRGAGSDSFGHSTAAALEILDARQTTPSAPGIGSTRRNWRAIQARGVVDHLLAELIRDRRSTGRAQPDLLGALLRARDGASGGRMDDATLRAETFSLLVAGSHTAASTLAWAWELLSRHGEVLRALQAEADEVLGPRAATSDDLQRLTLAGAVVDETLRLYPPSWGLPREAVVGDEIAGYRVPAGSLVVLCRWVTHRRAELWDEPARFDPLRFLGDGSSLPQPFAYYPLPGGPASTPSAELIRTLGQVALATLARDFDAAAPLGSIVEADASFTLRPRAPLPIHVARRFATPTSPSGAVGHAEFLPNESGILEVESARMCVVA
jgi:cytochrome P450